MLPATLESEVAESRIREASVIAGDDFQILLDALQRRGYQTIGPTVRDGAIVYEEIDGVEDLPVDWSDEQGPGHYKLEHRKDGAFFGYTLGLHAWKRYLYPPVTCLWRAVRNCDGFTIEEPTEEPPKMAFIGVRACELRAIEIQDKIYLEGPYTDPDYRERRASTFIVAMNCTRAGNTCFCTSMQSGPAVEDGFDLAMTELLPTNGVGEHIFVVEIGSTLGADLLADVPHRPAKPADLAAAGSAVEEAAENMGRSMQTEGLQALLFNNLESPQWDEVAERCLTCGNCTMVCPTCFCVTVEDVTDITGNSAERWRKTDSCFTSSFSYVYGGSVRASPKSRYRQWITHKLAGWIDQFDVSGCVGCGRCITWCPVGIDITQEVKTLRGETGEREQGKSERDERERGELHVVN
jgi:sulfhydrogenase subunit beta (sulfur reductase)